MIADRLAPPDILRFGSTAAKNRGSAPAAGPAPAADDEGRERVGDNTRALVQISGLVQQRAPRDAVAEKLEDRRGRTNDDGSRHEQLDDAVAPRCHRKVLVRRVKSRASLREAVGRRPLVATSSTTGRTTTWITSESADPSAGASIDHRLTNIAAAGTAGPDETQRPAASRKST